MIPITNTKLGIGIPLNFPQVPSAFFDSFVQLERPTFEYLRSSYGGIEEMRNDIVERAFATGCTHLIMMDTDMIYPPDTIPKLMAHNLPVVGALCFMRYPPFSPVLRVGDPGSYKNLETWEMGSLVEVDATGTACILFDMEVFRKIPKPWFEFMKHPNDLIGGKMGEDISFCWKLKNAGYRIYVDSSIHCSHITLMEIDYSAYLLYKKLAELKNKKIKEV